MTEPTLFPSRGTNLAVVRGVLSRDATARTLPSGDVVLAYEVTVRRPDGKAESVPVAWVNPDRRAPSDQGTEVLAVGRIRRRFYRAGGATQSRTELVADHVVPLTRKVTIASIVSALIDQLSDSSEP